ncbi:hypothetical protein C8J56DRAFT_883770 [Mycena floridula]|nr:hypothetical protein C8J56DRAFT_883770 [Mycena floridula]
MCTSGYMYSETGFYKNIHFAKPGSCSVLTALTITSPLIGVKLWAALVPRSGTQRIVVVEAFVEVVVVVEAEVVVEEVEPRHPTYWYLTAIIITNLFILSACQTFSCTFRSRALEPHLAIQRSDYCDEIRRTVDAESMAA